MSRERLILLSFSLIHLKHNHMTQMSRLSFASLRSMIFRWPSTRPLQILCSTLHYSTIHMTTVSSILIEMWKREWNLSFNKISFVKSEIKGEFSSQNLKTLPLFYFAISCTLDSRMTLTLICPGYCISSSMRFATS